MSMREGGVGWWQRGKSEREEEERERDRRERERESSTNENTKKVGMESIPFILGNFAQLL